jgi:hypothetical protein
VVIEAGDSTIVKENVLLCCGKPLSDEPAKKKAGKTRAAKNQ